MADPNTELNIQHQPVDCPTRPPGDSGPLIHQSGDLLQGRREVWIEHGDQMYRLRLTSRGSLYLTK